MNIINAIITAMDCDHEEIFNKYIYTLNDAQLHKLIDKLGSFPARYHPENEKKYWQIIEDLRKTRNLKIDAINPEWIQTNILDCKSPLDFKRIHGLMP